MAETLATILDEVKAVSEANTIIRVKTPRVYVTASQQPSEAGEPFVKTVLTVLRTGATFVAFDTKGNGGRAACTMILDAIRYVNEPISPNSSVTRFMLDLMRLVDERALAGRAAMASAVAQNDAKNARLPGYKRRPLSNEDRIEAFGVAVAKPDLDRRLSAWYCAADVYTDIEWVWLSKDDQVIGDVPEGDPLIAGTETPQQEQQQTQEAQAPPPASLPGAIVIAGSVNTMMPFEIEAASSQLDTREGGEWVHDLHEATLHMTQVMMQFQTRNLADAPMYDAFIEMYGSRDLRLLYDAFQRERQRLANEGQDEELQNRVDHEADANEDAEADAASLRGRASSCSVVVVHPREQSMSSLEHLHKIIYPLAEQLQELGDAMLAGYSRTIATEVMTHVDALVASPTPFYLRAAHAACAKHERSLNDKTKSMIRGIVEFVLENVPGINA